MKLAKLSLAAILAAGAITTLSASSLEDAVKNTDINGQIRYRFEDISSDDSSNNYRINVNTKSKINDDLSANVGLLVNDTTKKSEWDFTPMIAEAFFTYTGIENLTAKVGKQEVTSVFEDNKASGGTGATGTGLSLNYDFGGATLGLARFVNNNSNTDDLSIVSLAGNIVGVDASANYHVSTDEDETKRLAVLANTNVAVSEDVSVSVDAAYAQRTAKTDANEGSQYRIILGTDVSGFGVKLGYAANGKKGASVSLQKDAKANLRLHQAHMDDAGKDATAIFASLGAKITDNVGASISYLGLSDFTSTTNDATELLAKVTYKMSKNFKTYAFYSVLDSDNAVTTISGGNVPKGKTKKVRVEAKYTF